MFSSPPEQARHRSIVGKRERELAFAIIRFGQSTEQDGSGASLMWMVSDAGSAGIASANGTVMELALGALKHASKSTSSAVVTRREFC